MRQYSVHFRKIRSGEKAMKNTFRDKDLSFEKRCELLLAQLTIDEKIGMLSSHMEPVERLGIGEWFVGCEVARGFVGRDEKTVSTVFPQPIGMASMFDPELMEKLGKIASDEARYYYERDKNGKLMLWGPTVDMERDPRWGRTEEAYGEDPYLTGEMTKAYTKGLLGEDKNYYKTVPTLKHFCANNNEYMRGSCSANINPRLLHEYYYRAFKLPITEGGAKSMMAAYNELAGVPAVMNPDLQKLVKDEWGLDFIVTDGGDFSQNVLSHKYVPTHGEALALCLKNGADSMTDGADMVREAAKDALERGLLSEVDIDKAVGNVLLARFRLGEFDETHPYKGITYEVDTKESKALNKQAAMEQVCLLKNEGILPLAKGKKVAVIGPLADENYRDWYTGVASYAVSIKEGIEKEYGKEYVTFDNGYDIVAIKSRKNDNYLAVAEESVIRAVARDIDKTAMFEYHDWDFGSINYRAVCNNRFVKEDGTYKAISEVAYEWFIREWFKPVSYEKDYMFHAWFDWKMDIIVDENDNLTTDKPKRPQPNRLFEQVLVESGCERAKKLAKEADVVILCVGNHPMQVARECYDRPNLELPKHQKELVKAVYEANPQTVLVVASSYPYAINFENEHLSAILYTSHAGAELGNAVAKTLVGENNPSARCPMTWYTSERELPDIMDYDIIENDSTYLYYTGKPLYAFGHGLSYSTFVYEEFSVKPCGEGLEAKVTVKNQSTQDGNEVVQVYFKHNHSTVKRPRKQLCAFRRVFVPAGECVKVSIPIQMNALEFYDVSNEKLCVEQGMHTFMVGASSEDIRQEQELWIEGTSIKPRDLTKVILAKNYDACDNATLAFSMDENDHYMISGDWGGYLVLNEVALRGYKEAIIRAAAPCNTAGIKLYYQKMDEEHLLGEVVIAPSPSAQHFAEYRVPLQFATGNEKLFIQLEKMVSMYSIYFN